MNSCCLSCRKKKIGIKVNPLQRERWEKGEKGMERERERERGGSGNRVTMEERWQNRHE